MKAPSIRFSTFLIRKVTYMESSLHGKFYTCKISCQQLQTESRCISACAGWPLNTYTNPPNHQNFCTDHPQCSHTLKTMVSWCTGYVFSASFFLYMYIHVGSILYSLRDEKRSFNYIQLTFTIFRPSHTHIQKKEGF